VGSLFAAVEIAHIRGGMMSDNWLIATVLEECQEEDIGAVLED
jgi:hypothetical protein